MILLSFEGGMKTKPSTGCPKKVCHIWINSINRIRCHQMESYCKTPIDRITVIVFYFSAEVLALLSISNFFSLCIWMHMDFMTITAAAYLR